MSREPVNYAAVIFWIMFVCALAVGGICYYQGTVDGKAAHCPAGTR